MRFVGMDHVSGYCSKWQYSGPPPKRTVAPGVDLRLLSFFHASNSLALLVLLPLRAPLSFAVALVAESEVMPTRRQSNRTQSRIPFFLSSAPKLNTIRKMVHPAAPEGIVSAQHKEAENAKAAEAGAVNRYQLGPEKTKPAEPRGSPTAVVAGPFRALLSRRPSCPRSATSWWRRTKGRPPGSTS